MKLILFILMTYLVYRFLSRFFTPRSERPNAHWKTFYTNVPPTHQTPKEKDISSKARVIEEEK
ncbi:hypothetical protein [Leptospira alstonii]|uniref:Uncharacterized protein n=2 Tax=Leptospira alstonii TaxID=28452 RepID=M6CWW2_9LEPT|nr:hypothetical protein [Leptospira alstonii]EMJ93423.1 hypothetical protein LEP1GSC194_2142 [Leptospira alstonii serovar Sichuan str. 79601]EQA80262.1 hypothetical protein LEP1GSC193_4377 [Leptospira alstonii serovar Pingchang str. 80-412]